MTAVRQRPTKRQLEVLRAYTATRSIGVAAHLLGIAEGTVKQLLCGLNHRTECTNAAQAACLLGSGAFERPAGTLDDELEDAGAHELGSPRVEPHRPRLASVPVNRRHPLAVRRAHL